ncbi:MAG: helix-turn-helix domain-containing protein [Nitrosopumilaceae archaeon]|jgi:predicted transcriptional regulator
MQAFQFENREINVSKFENDVNGNKNNLILKIVGDKYCRKILSTTTTTPKCASDIAATANIPISTIYRRLQNLVDAKLVKISGSISEDGKKFFLYKSTVKEIHTIVQGKSIKTVLVK